MGKDEGWILKDETGHHVSLPPFLWASDFWPLS